MQPKGAKDSLLSAGKPKNLPWFYWSVVLGLLGLVYLYLFFKN